MSPTHENERSFLAIDPRFQSRQDDRMDLQEKYTITVRMYKVERKISMRRSTSRWPLSHIGLEAVNTAQRAVGPEGIVHVAGAQDVKRPCGARFRGRLHK
jgi:hypothetical protein